MGEQHRRRSQNRQNADHAHVDSNARHVANHRWHVLVADCNWSVTTELIHPTGKRPGRKTTWPLGRDSPQQIAAQQIYFPPFGAGGTTTSLCCAQAPSPNPVTKTAITTIIFKNFNLSRLLSQQVAPVCLGRELGGSNAFLKFFKPCGRRPYFE